MPPQARRAHPDRRPGCRDHGMATAEMAVALPVLMLLVLTAIYAVQVTGMRVRCLDAAREVARAAARGDPRAATIGREVLPGSAVSVRSSGDTVTAVVTIRLQPLGHLPSVTVREQVTAATESTSIAAHPAGGRNSPDARNAPVARNAPDAQNAPEARNAPGGRNVPGARYLPDARETLGGPGSAGPGAARGRRT